MSKEKKLKIVINENGVLILNRAGKLKNQYYPFTNFAENCGDVCPLFNEPFFYDEHKMVEIPLCEDSLTCEYEEFEDRRGED